MKFLVAKNPESKKKAHLWDDGDTYCRMYSTGGMGKKKYHVVDSTERDVCQMCQNVFKVYAPSAVITTLDTSLKGVSYGQRDSDRTTEAGHSARSP